MENNETNKKQEDELSSLSTLRDSIFAVNRNMDQAYSKLKDLVSNPTRDFKEINKQLDIINNYSVEQADLIDSFIANFKIYQ